MVLVNRPAIVEHVLLFDWPPGELLEITLGRRQCLCRINPMAKCLVALSGPNLRQQERSLTHRTKIMRRRMPGPDRPRPEHGLTWSRSPAEPWHHRRGGYSEGIRRVLLTPPRRLQTPLEGSQSPPGPRYWGDISRDRPESL